MFALAEDEVLSRTRGLEAELAEARSKIKQLESRIETDALLDIFNRRGFERELTRAVFAGEPLPKDRGRRFHRSRRLQVHQRSIWPSCRRCNFKSRG